jgi:2-polyprenyl-3-methyl-5-hydroxy-6-metoxy-1,4-benzoquinol methylase
MSPHASELDEQLDRTESESIEPDSDPIAVERDAFVARFVGAALGFLDITAVWLGDRLGYYRALADHGPLTSGALAERTATSERYAREWLEHQAVSGILTADDAAASPSERRYAIPAGHVEPLLDRDSLAFMAPFGELLVGCAMVLPAVLEAFRTGGGVPYRDYGAVFHEAIAAGNRPFFLKLIGTEWLPAIPDLHARLQAQPPARVADVGCGQGWSSIAIAQAYPAAQVDGFDLDDGSIAAAMANAEAAGVADRARFHVRNAGDPGLAGQYDLAIAFQCIHDMANPVAALTAMRSLTEGGGTVIVADELAAETFGAPGDELERLIYGFSILHCLPVGMVDQPSAGTGTAMRPDTLRRYARDAGFREMEILPIESDKWRFYRLLV